MTLGQGGVDVTMLLAPTAWFGVRLLRATAQRTLLCFWKLAYSIFQNTDTNEANNLGILTDEVFEAGTPQRPIIAGNEPLSSEYGTHKTVKARSWPWPGQILALAFK